MGDLRGELMKAMEAGEVAAEEPVETSAAAPEPESADAPTEALPAQDAHAEPSEEAKPAEGERSRDESGRFAKDGKKPTAAKAKEVKPTAPVAPKAPVAPAAQVKPTQPAAEKPSEPALKAPSSWKPQAREKWGALPAEVQQEVLRVDGEVRRVLQGAAETRRSLQGWQQAVSPFEPMIRAEGHEPQKAVESLLRQAHLMRFGAPAQKAQFVEALIERNQVPVDAGMVARLIQKGRVPIEALVEALEGKAPPAGQGAPPSAPAFDPNAMEQRLLSQLEQRMQRQQLEREAASARSEVESFLTGKEFADDVRATMADLMEVRARAGQVLSVADAYELAVKLHPDIAPVLQQRAEAGAVKAKQAAAAKARAAASSVKSQPTGAPPAPKPTGLRAQLEDSWAAAEGG